MTFDVFAVALALTGVSIALVGLGAPRSSLRLLFSLIVLTGMVAFNVHRSPLTTTSLVVLVLTTIAFNAVPRLRRGIRPSSDR